MASELANGFSTLCQGILIRVMPVTYSCLLKVKNMYSRTALAAVYAIMPAACVAWLVILLMLRSRRQRKVLPSTIAWWIVAAALAVWATIWCLLGLITADAGTLGIFCLVCVGTGTLSLWREELLDRSESSEARWAPALRVVKNALCILGAAALSVLALEVPWNALVWQLPHLSVAIELALVGLAITGGYFLAQRHGAGGMAGVIFATVIGLAQYFVSMFKGAAILPSDVLGLGTAMAVGSNYVYSISATALSGITYALCAAGLLMLARRRPGTTTQEARAKNHELLCRVLRVVGRTAVGAASVAACLTLFLMPSYKGAFGIYIPDYWWALNRYSEYGFLPTFASAVQDLPIQVPEGYTDETAETIEQNMALQERQAQSIDPAQTQASAQFEQTKPSIVVIMNESYSDLSIFDQLGGSYSGPDFLQNPPDGTLLQGQLAVSVLGGGTCNTEFEFLTGTSMHFVGDGKYPYTLYGFSQAPSLARQLRGLGYHTTAIHPNKATNWNRNRVYSELGFDDAQFEDSFKGAEHYHNGVSDAATYDHILDVLRSSDQPQFVFDVTMQNHSGYDTGNIPAADKVDLELPKQLDGNTASEVDEYLSCIHESDRALSEFTEQLRELNRPVVLVFFGDHQPFFTATINDSLYKGEDDAAHTERTHQTCYTVWANYDVAGSTAQADSQATSASELAALSLRQVGAPLTDYQEATLAAARDVPQLNALGYLTADGTWHAPTEPNDTLQNLAYVEYLEFARKVE